jgi:hypothetical protein
MEVRKNILRLTGRHFAVFLESHVKRNPSMSPLSSMEWFMLGVMEALLDESNSERYTSHSSGHRGCNASLVLIRGSSPRLIREHADAISGTCSWGRSGCSRSVMNPGSKSKDSRWCSSIAAYIRASSSPMGDCMLLVSNFE